jgi:hypothetical protein
MFPDDQIGQFQPPRAVEDPLKRWTAISNFFGIPIATPHRWASEGMPCVGKADLLWLIATR